MIYGVQLFGCSKEFRADSDKFFDNMKRIGLMQIEPCILFDEPEQFRLEALERGDSFFALLPELLWLPNEVKSFKNIIQNKGMVLSSAHAFVSDIDKSEELILDTLKGSGVTSLVLNVPALAFTDKEKSLKQLSKLANALGDIGVELWLHSLGDDIKHRVEDGSSLYLWLIKNCDKLYAQPDTGWVLYGGEDPYDFLISLEDKLRSIHFKDLNKNYKNLRGNDIFEPLGKGVIDVKKIMTLADRVVSVVIDQDFSRGDFVEDLKFSSEILNKF